MNPKLTSGVMEDSKTDAHRPCGSNQKNTYDGATEIINCIFSVTDLHNSFRQMSLHLSGNAPNIYWLGKTLISLIIIFCFCGYVCYNHWNSANMFMIHAREGNGNCIHIMSMTSTSSLVFFIPCIKITIKNQRGVRKICRLAIGNCFLCSGS